MKPKSNYSTPAKDRCQTPPYALEPLFPYLDRIVSDICECDPTIWEPCCGEGYLSKALEDDGGFEVLSSDLSFGQDFLKMLPQCPYDAIVTNPPFSIKHKFVERCYALGKPFALLIPAECIGTERIQKHMRQHRDETGVLLLDRRVNFCMPNAGWADSSSQFPVLWLCYKLLDSQIAYGHIAPVAYTEEDAPPKGISKRMLPYQIPMFEGVPA